MPIMLPIMLVVKQLLLCMQAWLGCSKGLTKQQLPGTTATRDVEARIAERDSAHERLKQLTAERDAARKQLEQAGSRKGRSAERP